jgi:HD-like signal output (HDOD) protein
MNNPFRNLFRGKARPPEARAEAWSAGPVPVPAAAPAEPDPFDGPWAVLSGAEEPAPRPLSQEELDQVEALVPRVMEHFARNHPDPTSFPALAVRIIDLLNEPDVDMARLLKAISPDPAISINVLRVANSALYNRGTDVTEMRMAVMRIGLRGVGEIAAGVAGRSLFDVGLRVEYEIFGDRWSNLFLDTMAVAFGASQFAFEQNVGRADRAFLAGMFHDMGKSLALRSLAALVIAGDVASPLPGPVVDEVLERAHVDIGCAVHEIWGLPAHLQDICRRHHDAVVPDGPDDMEIHILRMVSGVHRLVKDPADPGHLAETRQSIGAMRLVRRGVSLLHREMEQHVEKVKILFPV